jgi:hypothetical protein
LIIDDFDNGPWAVHKTVLSKSAIFRKWFERDPDMTRVRESHRRELHRLHGRCEWDDPADLGWLICFLYTGSVEQHVLDNYDRIFSDFLRYLWLWYANEYHQIAALDTFIFNEMPRALEQDYGYHAGIIDFFESLGDSQRDMLFKRKVVKALYIDLVSFFVKKSEEDTEKPGCDKFAELIEQIPQLGTLLMEALIEDLGSNNAQKLSFIIKEMVFGKGWLISGKKSRDFE